MRYEPQPADVVCFSGRSRISQGIKLATCSDITHVGTVAHIERWQLRKAAMESEVAVQNVNGFKNQMLLFESTTLNSAPCLITGKAIDGVQAHDPMQRIKDYDGQVWFYRLTPAWRNRFHHGTGPADLGDYLLSKIGRPYDSFEALESGSNILQYLSPWRWIANLFACSRENYTERLFCSEYVAGALRLVGLYPLGSVSKVSPARLIKMLIASEIYETKRDYQLKVEL